MPGTGWQNSGVPRFKKKGRDADRVCFYRPVRCVEPDRRHLTFAGDHTIRTRYNTRRLSGSNHHRQLSGAGAGDHRKGAATRTRLDASVCPTPNSGAWRLDSRVVGVDVGAAFGPLLH